MGEGSVANQPQQEGRPCRSSSSQFTTTTTTTHQAQHVPRNNSVNGNTQTQRQQQQHLQVQVREGDDNNTAQQQQQHTPPPSLALSASSPQQQPPAPFPYGQIAVLAVVLLNESLCSTMLMPFIGLYVAHLLGTSTEAAGYASGALIGLFQLGQVLSGRAWGGLSDEYGRKPALIGGLLLSGVIMFFFGFSESFHWCVILRFAHGLCNGNILVAKAMIPEAVPSAHEAKGYAVVSLTWGIGSLVGPAIGGILYDPTRHAALQKLFGWNNNNNNNHNNTSGSNSGHLFVQYPALLPALSISIYAFLAASFAFFCLKETNPRILRIRDTEEEEEATAVGRSILIGNISAGITTIRCALVAVGARVMGVVQRGRGRGYHRVPPRSSSATTHQQQQRPLSSGASALEDDDDEDDGTCFNKHNDACKKDVIRMMVISPTNTNTTTCRNIHAEQPDTAVTPTDTLLNDSNNADSTVTPAATSSVTRPFPAAAAAAITAPASTSTAAGTAAPYGYREAFANPLVARVCLMYALIAIADINYVEIGPLWAVSSFASGGLGLGPGSVGMIIVLSGLPCIVANIFMAPLLRRYGGPIPLWVVSCFGWAIPVVLLPTCSRFLIEHFFNTGNKSNNDMLLAASRDSFSQDASSPQWLWKSIVTGLLLAVIAVRQAASSWCFGIIFLLIGRSAPPGRLGAINGVAQSVGSAVRCVAPMLFAPLFAWSIAPAEQNNGVRPQLVTQPPMINATSTTGTDTFSEISWAATSAASVGELSHKRPFPFDHNLCFVLSAAILSLAAYLGNQLRHHPAAGLEAPPPPPPPAPQEHTQQTSKGFEIQGGDEEGTCAREIISNITTSVDISGNHTTNTTALQEASDDGSGGDVGTNTTTTVMMMVEMRETEPAPNTIEVTRTFYKQEEATGVSTVGTATSVLDHHYSQQEHPNPHHDQHQQRHPLHPFTVSTSPLPSTDGRFLLSPPEGTSPPPPPLSSSPHHPSYSEEHIVIMRSPGILHEMLILE